MSAGGDTMTDAITVGVTGGPARSDVVQRQPEAVLPEAFQLLGGVFP